VERVVGFFGGSVVDGHGPRSLRIISDPTAVKVNFARSSFGRLRMPSPSCANAQRSCAKLPIGPTLTIACSTPSLPHTGHRHRSRTSAFIIHLRRLQPKHSLWPNGPRRVCMLQISTQFAQHLCADRAEANLGVPPPKPTIPCNVRGPRLRANKHQTNKLGVALFVRSS
jgi:hypothetical protein